MTHAEPDPLPPRPPRPLIIHAVVDAAVAFLAVAIVGLFLGATLWTLGVVAVVIGVLAAPFTRRAEEQALSRREPPSTEPAER